MDLLSNTMIVRIPAILIALTVHELAHGLAAKRLGDRTAEQHGRLTLNPLSHLDLFGTLMLLFGPFGWAKPVPVNPACFKDPRKGMALVAAAGPLSNIMMAAVTGLFFRFGLVSHGSVMWNFLALFFLINIGLAVFNLLPVHPLDGSRILTAFLRPGHLSCYARIMGIVPKVFLVMITAEWLLDIPVLSYLLNPVFIPAFRLAEALFIGT